jgi:hypothetical protein
MNNNNYILQYYYRIMIYLIVTQSVLAVLYLSTAF